ncbi:MAG: carbohydrate ABC transporter permease [Oscillospiraceae bacterium]|nr:carbohydrate ABC transporter permease [Oscillospiraceae bacterium]
MGRTLKGIRRAVFYLVLCGLVVFAIYPIAYALLGSLKTNQEFVRGGTSLLPQNGWQFVNYQRAWKLAEFEVYIGNSVFITTISTFFVLLFISMCGYAFARDDFYGKKALQGCILATMFISVGTVTIYPTMAIVRDLKLLNSRWGLVIVYAFAVNASGIYLYQGYVKGLSREMDEAAVIDGCGFFAVYWRIVLPLSTPILATLGLLSFKACWNDYLLPLVMTISAPKLRTLTVGVVSLKNVKDGAAAWDIMLAGTSISLVPVLVLYLFCNQYFIAGITAGAVKG